MQKANGETTVVVKKPLKKVSQKDKIIGIINPLSEGRASVSKSLELLASALTLVAGLAWNDAIKGFIEKSVQPAMNQLFNQTLGNLASVVAPFIYAIIITFLVVYFVTRIKKIEERFEREEAEREELD